MNDEQIKKELRRSACEDFDPYDGCEVKAFVEACEWKNMPIPKQDHEHWRIFFLLVAEAM